MTSQSSYCGIPITMVSTVIFNLIISGLIDCIEFICGLIIFSNCRVEDKIRFLFEFFDMNDNNYLEECDL
jgi:Ca2+-binding EF-hand superfamily protein